MSQKQRVDGEHAYILHTYPYSETSLILEVFSKGYGRVALLARGARRPRATLRGVIMTFAPLELGWFGGGEVKTLAKAEWLGGLPMLSGQSLLLGYYLNELLLRMLPREDAHPSLFDTYGTALSALAGASGGYSDKSEASELRRFERSLLRELGYDYALHALAETGEPVLPQGRYVVLIGQGAAAAALHPHLPAVCGQTLLDMAADHFSAPRTRVESKMLMRQLVTHYLGNQSLHSRRIFAAALGIAGQDRRDVVDSAP